MADLARSARYPFLPQAADYIENEGPDLNELLTDRVYASVRARGRERALIALEEAALPAPPLGSNSPPRDLLEELLAYAYGRILVSALGDAYVVRRYALAEAVRVRDLLLNDPDKQALTACAETLGLTFTPMAAGGYQAHFTEYLRFSVHIKDMDWKLVKQPLRGGIVQMDLARASRLVQEALRRRIEEELPKPLPPDVMKAVAADVAPLREAAEARKEKYKTEGSFGKVDLSLMPPCMQHILGQLQRGENAPHNARFAIVTFLNKIGMTSEDIMQLFAQAPDFREDLTRYQVEHITGVTSSTSYSVPGCDNMKTFNLCAADDLCKTTTKAGVARVRYPGDYYRYMAEAQAYVDQVVAHMPLANPRALTIAAASNYALLKSLERSLTRPIVERVEPKLLVAMVRKRNVPFKLEGEGDDAKLIVDEADPWGVVHLLESEWLAEAVPRTPGAA